MLARGAGPTDPPSLCGLICDIHSGAGAGLGQCPDGASCKRAGKSIAIGVCTYDAPPGKAAPAGCAAKKADCHKCSEDASACVRCYNGKYLHRGQCVEHCPPPAAPVGSGKFNRRCVAPSIDGTTDGTTDTTPAAAAATTTAANNLTAPPPAGTPNPACVRKKNNCHECSSAEGVAVQVGIVCTMCKNKHYLHQGVCVEKCPAGMVHRGAGNFKRLCSAP